MSLMHGQNFIDETFYQNYKESFFARLKKESADPAQKLHTKQSRNLMKHDYKNPPQAKKSRKYSAEGKWWEISH